MENESIISLGGTINFNSLASLYAQNNISLCIKFHFGSFKQVLKIGHSKCRGGEEGGGINCFFLSSYTLEAKIGWKTLVQEKNPNRPYIRPRLIAKYQVIFEERSVVELFAEICNSYSDFCICIIYFSIHF